MQRNLRSIENVESRENFPTNKRADRTNVNNDQNQFSKMYAARGQKKIPARNLFLRTDERGREKNHSSQYSELRSAQTSPDRFSIVLEDYVKDKVYRAGDVTSEHSKEICTFALV